MTQSAETPILSAQDRSWSQVKFQVGKVLLPQELNLAQGIEEESRKFLTSFLGGSGFLKTFSPQSGVNNSYFIHVDPDNSMQVALVGGHFIAIGGTYSSDPGTVAITLPSPPHTSGRTDLVFLEVWLAEIVPGQITNKPSTTTIYKFGNIQFQGTQLTDDLIWSHLNVETARRIQVQYRVRVVSNVNFSLDTGDEINSKGLLDPNVLAQGVRPSGVSGYTFRRVPNDPNLFVAGTGTNTDISNLGTYDGFVYALPIHKVTRTTSSTINLDDISAIADRTGATTSSGGTITVQKSGSTKSTNVDTLNFNGNRINIQIEPQVGAGDIAVLNFSIPDGGAGGGSLSISQDGTSVNESTSLLNFTGGVVLTSPPDTNEVDINIPTTEVVVGDGVTVDESIDSETLNRTYTISGNFETGGTSQKILRSDNSRILTTLEKSQFNELVGGGVTALHSHAGSGSGSGTITGVVAGIGLSGGGTSGSVTVNVNTGTGLTVGSDDKVAVIVGTTSGTIAAGDDSRFLTVDQKTDLTDGGITNLHIHDGLLTADQKTDLTDGGYTTLHKHSDLFPTVVSVSADVNNDNPDSTFLGTNGYVLRFGPNSGEIAQGTEVQIIGQSGLGQMALTLTGTQLPKGPSGAVVTATFDMDTYRAGAASIRESGHKISFRYKLGTLGTGYTGTTVQTTFRDGGMVLEDGFRHGRYEMSPITIASNVSTFSIIMTCTGLNTNGGRGFAIMSRCLTVKVFPKP